MDLKCGSEVCVIEGASIERAIERAREGPSIKRAIEVPGGATTAAVAPMPDTYVPMGARSHFTEPCPGMGLEKDPSPHSVHAVSPSEPEYCPGGHIVHAVAPAALEKLLMPPHEAGHQRYGPSHKQRWGGHRVRQIPASSARYAARLARFAVAPRAAGCARQYTHVGGVHNADVLLWIPNAAVS